MTPTTRPRLVAPDDDHVSRADIARAAIDQSHREWRSPWADVTAKGWVPYTGPTGKCANDTREITRRQYRIVAESRLPLWRRIIRYMKGLR